MAVVVREAIGEYRNRLDPQLTLPLGTRLEADGRGHEIDNRS